MLVDKFQTRSFTRNQHTTTARGRGMGGGGSFLSGYANSTNSTFLQIMLQVLLKEVDEYYSFALHTWKSDKVN